MTIKLGQINFKKPAVPGKEGPNHHEYQAPNDGGFQRHSGGKNADLDDLDGLEDLEDEVMGRRGLQRAGGALGLNQPN